MKLKWLQSRVIFRFARYSRLLPSKTPPGPTSFVFCQETFARVCERWLQAVQRASWPWAVGSSALARVNLSEAWWKENHINSSHLPNIFKSTIIINDPFFLNANLPKQHVTETKQTKQTENNNNIIHLTRYSHYHLQDRIQDAPREMSAWNLSRVEGHTHSNNEGAGGLSIPHVDLMKLGVVQRGEKVNT